MSPLFQMVLFNNCLIKLLIPWMSPLFQLVLFNFLFDGRPYLVALLFNNSTTATAYSTFYSDGRPYLVALFIQQLVLFNNCVIQLLIQLFIRMAALIWSHFLFNFLFLFNFNGHPYLVTLLITTDLLLFFFLWKKRCLTWIRTRDLLICSLDAYR